MAETYVRVKQDVYEDSETVVRCDRWVEGGGGITSGVSSGPFVVCTGDGRVDR